jgi:outer membrane protein OmpA-like peptidoglycan-associated protein
MPLAVLVLGLFIGGCAHYNVPGGDQPWPKLSHVPDRPNQDEIDARRRRLYQQYGDLERALPEVSEKPAHPPAGALKVAVIQFPRAGVKLDDRAREVLAQVAAYAQQARANIMLFGYSSLNLELASSGNIREAAKGIAAARLRAVGVELFKQGVPFDRVELIARGNHDPAYRESKPTGEAGNRRVEIWFTR